MSRVAVLGAGPAGLWAAWKAAAAGHEVQVLERAMGPGGMAASVEVAGLRVDFGSHRLHPSTDPSILAELRRLLGAGGRGGLAWRPRNGRIRLEGRWVAFPLRAADAARSLPPSFLAGAARDAATRRLRRPREDSFAEVVRAGLGPTMLERFYGPYARKLWGVDAEQLAGEQARRRIGAATPTALLQRLRRRERLGFWYPRRGFGAIPEALADAAAEAGAELRYGTEVRDLADVDADHVWSTLPLPALAPPELRTLRSRALVLVHLALDADRWTPFDAHYLPGGETPVSRVSEPRNYRDGAFDPPGRTVLCAEVPCDVGDATWCADDGALAARVASDLAAAGLPPVDPVEVATRRLPAAYPVFLRGYEEGLAALERWAEAAGVVNLGRGGLFAHDNTHHALATGAAAAAALRPDGTWDAGSWAAARARFRRHVVED